MKNALYIRVVRARQRMGILWPILINGTMLGLVFILGSLGYHWIEGWPFFDGFYMVLITLATIGYGEVFPLSYAGRWLTVIIILVGIIYFALLIGYLVQLASEGRVFQMMRRRKVDRTIAALEGHCVVCGFGLLGRVVAAELAADGVDVVVIESNEKKAEDIEAAGFFLVTGDATSDDVLTRVGIGKAKALVAAMNNDPSNVYVVLSARSMNADLFIVSRASDSGHIGKLHRAGANRVVMPHFIGGQSIARAIQRPTVESFMHMHDTRHDEVHLDEVQVSSQSSLVGQSLAESGLSKSLDINVIAIKTLDSQALRKTRAETIITAGDTLLVAGAKAGLNKLREMM